MCPACVASAALFTTSVVYTGGLAAVVSKLFRKKKTSSKVSDIQNAKENSK